MGLHPQPGPLEAATRAAPAARRTGRPRRRHDLNDGQALDRFLQTDPRDVGCAEAMELQASLCARRAATEDTNRYRLALRLVPAPVASIYYISWLRRVSNYLTSRPR